MPAFTGYPTLRNRKRGDTDDYQRYQRHAQISGSERHTDRNCEYNKGDITGVLNHGTKSHDRQGAHQAKCPRNIVSDHLGYCRDQDGDED